MTASSKGFSYRLYCLLLYGYPAQFRRMYAREMARTFRDSYRDAVQQHGRSGVLGLWSIVLYDLGVSLFIEHLSTFKAWLKQLLAIEERHGKTFMSLTNIVFAQRTDTGLKRQSNEDSVISILPEDQQVMASKGVLFVVADGLGGHTRGEVASQLAVNDLYYQQESDDPATSLRLAMEEVNARIYEKNLSESSQAEPDKMMGTTCVAAVVQGDTLYIANVGDSRAYIVRSGQAQQISLDHSVVAKQLREGLITKEQAINHPERNKIYRCLGIHDVVEVDTFSEKVQAGDLLLLCTDGLSELVAEEEFVGIVQQYEPQESVQRLIERANEMGGRDNITAVVARVA